MGEIITCKMCCLLCSNSFSEPETDGSGEDILHCMAKDGVIVNPMDCCDEYN